MKMAADGYKAHKALILRELGVGPCQSKGMLEGGLGGWWVVGGKAVGSLGLVLVTLDEVM